MSISENNVRIIPKLEVKGPNIVKPVHTEALRVIGNPVELAQKYFFQGADELIYLDIVASLYQRPLDLDLLKSVAEKLFVPITAGGGIKSLQDINNILKAGADKISINTFAINNPDFIKVAAQKFGSQCITLYIEAKKTSWGYEAYTDGGREKTGVNAVEWAKKAIELGVGEILVTSIDTDGAKTGYDLALLKEITAFSQVPVIAAGGAGNPEHIYQAIEKGADAIAVSSILHYNLSTIGEIKKYLAEKNVNVRI